MYMNMAIDFEEQQGKGIEEYIGAFKRRKKQFIIPAVVVFVIILLAALLWPSTYRSTATILIEQQELPQDLVRSTVTSLANQQIQIITQRIMTMNNVMGLVEDYNIYTEDELRRLTRTEILQEFSETMKLDVVSAEVVDPRTGRPGETTIAFNLSYDHGSPLVAQKVANELVNLYLNENLKSRQEKSLGASEFLKAEVDALNLQIVDQEQRIALFKEENKESLPELYQYNLNIIERADGELINISYRLKELEKNKLELESRLAQLSPYAPTVLPTGEPVLSDNDRMKALRSELSRKLSIYSSSHPDIIRLQREIEALESGLGVSVDRDYLLKELKVAQDVLSQLKQKYEPAHPKVSAQESLIDELKADLDNSTLVTEVESPKADNPGYLFIETQFEGAKAEIAILKKQQQELDQKIKKYEGYVLRTPMIEKTFQEISRDLTNSVVKYQEMRAKQLQADVAKSLEADRKGERFTLIQPPIAPEKPVSPNRTALIIVGFILAMGAGVGVVLLLEVLDPGLRGEKQLKDVLGASPLLAVPYIKTDEELSKNNRQLYMIIAGIFVAGILALILFHFFVKPLDVTWYLVSRKLGIGY